MNINKYLLKFLKDYVNINQSRLDTANDNISGVTAVIENSDIFSSILVGNPTPQGSLRHGTIIKPVDEDDTFDTDLLVEIKKPSDWQYSDCLKKIGKIFSEHGTYKDKLDTSKTRCITINYAGENSLDIVPTFQEDGEYYIVNGKDNTKELSDGEGFAQWFDGQNKKTNGNLKKVIRLIKYIRNYQGLFDITSIHLNVLMGKAVDDGGDFASLQSTFTSIFSNLDTYLSDKTKVEQLDLINPANFNENMGENNRNFSDNELIKFKAFVNDISNILSSSVDEEAAIVKLRKFLGDELGDIYFDDYTDSQRYQGENIVEKLSLSGKRLYGEVEILDARYRIVENGSTVLKRLKSGYQISHDGVNLDFECHVTGVSDRYDVYWQVLNTGEEAKAKNALRGDIFKGKNRASALIEQHKNEETTAYKGIHWIKCYVVQRGFLVAESRKFYVKII